MVNLYINYNNLKNPFIRKKISKLFFYALKDKIEQKDKLLKDDFCKDNFFFEVNIKYVSKKEMLELNNRFRGVKKATDVLSFPLMFIEDNSMEEYNLLGDIVICKEIAKEQSKKLGHSFKREVCFLALHGFLHLLGYNHIDKEEEKQMIKKSKEILEKYRVKR